MCGEHLVGSAEETRYRGGGSILILCRPYSVCTDRLASGPGERRLCPRNAPCKLLCRAGPVKRPPSGLTAGEGRICTEYSVHARKIHLPITLPGHLNNMPGGLHSTALFTPNHTQQGDCRRMQCSTSGAGASGQTHLVYPSAVPRAPTEYTSPVAASCLHASGTCLPCSGT